MTANTTSLLPIYHGPEAQTFLTQLKQPQLAADTTVQQRASDIIQKVRHSGDMALREICQQLGDAMPTILSPDHATVQTAMVDLPAQTKTVMDRAAQRIIRFAQAMVDRIGPITVSDTAIQSGVRFQPIHHVACYVPGGRYPLPSTALMTTLTAKAAGVPEITLISPKLGPEVLYAGQLAGVTRYIQLGGAQAVAAMAFGTETIPQAAMVVGPGNAYVTEAKRQLQGLIGIDGLAGPSEVVIIADDTANPNWVAADLIAQAEHDPDARTYLLTPSATLAQATQAALHQQLASGAYPEFIQHSLTASGALVLGDIAQCCAAANQLAPEHLELMVNHPESIMAKLTDFGAMFCGHQTPVPIGDYMAGPNHTLPTARAARFSGGLTPLTFLRPQTWMQVTGNDTQIFEDAGVFADLEGLTGHAQSARLRQ